jgi:hypothetical protein
MNIPVMYYVGCGFNWLLFLLSIGGYFYVLNKTSKKWSFILVFAAAWAVSGLSYVFLVSGVSSDEWYITLLRVITYILFVSTLLSMIVELVKSGENSS